MVASRFEVFLVNLEAPEDDDGESRKIRPCLVVSPDEMNQNIKTVIVAPLTTRGRPYPTRVACQFKGKAGQVILDQLQTVDASRLVSKLGRLDRKAADHVLEVLSEMFAA